MDRHLVCKNDCFFSHEEIPLFLLNLILNSKICIESIEKLGEK